LSENGQLERTEDEDVAGDDQDALAQPHVVVVSRLVRQADDPIQPPSDPVHRSAVRR
jgi:hypothetical protein